MAGHVGGFSRRQLDLVGDPRAAQMWLDSTGEVSVASALVAANPCTEAALGLP